MFSVDDANADDDPINLDLTNYSEVGHTHEITDVINLEERLEAIEQAIEALELQESEAKLSDDDERSQGTSSSQASESINIDLTDYSKVGHTHEISDITNLGEKLEAIERSIEDLELQWSEAKLDEDVSINIDLTNYSEVGHTHAISEIDTLQETLESKADVSTVGDLQIYIDELMNDKAEADHEHESSSITDFKQAIVDLIYPVGSIYTCATDSTDQLYKIGGTWEYLDVSVSGLYLWKRTA